MRIVGRIAAMTLALVVALPSVANAQNWEFQRRQGWHHAPRPAPAPGYRVGPQYGGPHHYNGGPRYHHGGDDGGAALAAGIIGLAAGAIIAGAASGNGHVARCSRTYRSYDPSSDTFVDRNGNTRRCRL